mgnify:CR=1 FL=1
MRGAALQPMRQGRGIERRSSVPGRDLFHQVTSYSAREVGRFGAPSLITRTTNDVQQIQMLVVMAVTMMITAPLNLVIGIFFAVREDLGLSVILLFAIPDEDERRNHLEVKIPYAASLVLTHELDGLVQGLDSFEGQHPPVFAVFWSFRVMVGIGLAMLAVAWLASWKLRSLGSDRIPRWLLRVLVAMTFSGWIATLAGWYTTEIGRQPWLVQGVLDERYRYMVAYRGGLQLGFVHGSIAYGRLFL